MIMDPAVPYRFRGTLYYVAIASNYRKMSVVEIKGAGNFVLGMKGALSLYTAILCNLASASQTVGSRYLGYRLVLYTTIP